MTTIHEVGAKTRAVMTSQISGGASLRKGGGRKNDRYTLERSEQPRILVDDPAKPRIEAFRANADTPLIIVIISCDEYVVEMKVETGKQRARPKQLHLAGFVQTTASRGKPTAAR